MFILFTLERSCFPFFFLYTRCSFGNVVFVALDDSIFVLSSNLISLPVTTIVVSLSTFVVVSLFFASFVASSTVVKDTNPVYLFFSISDETYMIVFCISLTPRLLTSSRHSCTEMKLGSSISHSDLYGNYHCSQESRLTCTKWTFHGELRFRLNI